MVGSIVPGIANGPMLEYRSPPFSRTSEDAGRLAQGTKGNECCSQFAARDYKNRGRDLKRRHRIQTGRLAQKTNGNERCLELAARDYINRVRDLTRIHRLQTGRLDGTRVG